jgi:tRNA(Ile)-lysidine synthase
MLNAFQNHINQNLSFLKESKLLIAISGGLDSVVLTQLCHQANLKFALAHCNFNLRGNESDEDEAFVLQLAEDLDVEVFIESFETETYAKDHKMSTQMAARELRYDWFYALSEQLKFDYVLTAHHADDNLETFLINLSRGTGIDGLIGIPESNENIIRPLLPFSRVELLEFAEENHLNWREDSSNSSIKYVRNKIRLEVIPKLKAVNPEILQSVIQTQHHLQDSKAIIEDAIAKVQKKVVSTDGNSIRLNIKKLQKLSNSKAYLYELLKDFNFTEWNDVNNLLEAQSGKQVFSKTHRLLKDRTHLLLTAISSVDIQESIFISESTKTIETAIGTLLFEDVDRVHEKGTNTLFVDKDLLKFPLTLRPWRKGDYFCPLGMDGKKKLSKFFKDEKYSLLDKEQALVLCAEDHIIWIINKRSDNRFKVTNKTNKILKITLEL